MNNKLFLLISSFLLSSGFSQEVPLIKSAVTNKEGVTRQLYITGSTPDVIQYTETTISTARDTLPLSEVKSVFFFRPASFNKGLELYNQGKFSEAKSAFQKCKNEYAPLNKSKIKGNHSVRAAFYEMECARRMKDYETLDSLLKGFRPDTLLNEDQLTQLSLYPFFDAVKLKQWDRVTTLAEKWADKNVPGYQRGQVAYCHALALKEGGETEAALMKFNEVLAVSQLKEPEYAIDACESIIELTLADPKTKARFDKINDDSAEKKSLQYLNLRAAASVAYLWENLPIKDRALPAKYKSLLKLAGKPKSAKPAASATEKPTAKETEKPAGKPEEKKEKAGKK